MVKHRAKKKCPICSRPAAPDFAPFCSRRCADADLAKWLGGDYKIPTGEKAHDVPPEDGDE